MVLIYISLLLLIFYVLAKICEEYFIHSLDIISKKLRLSEDVAGATFMAIGSSAPELFTSLIALTKVGSEQIGTGTIVGSAIFNILVIVGASSVAATAYLKWRPVIRDLLFYILSILILLFTFSDGRITFIDVIYYLVGYTVYLLILSQWSKWFPDKESPEDELKMIHDRVVEQERGHKTKPLLFRSLLIPIDTILKRSFPDLDKQPKKYLRTFTISILYIIVLSFALVELAVLTAHELNIPEVVIALTVLAAGTSVPDLLSSVIVAKRGRGDMAVSNAVGSNTFDILIGLGFPWLLYIMYTGNAVIVGTENLMSSILLLFFTVISLLFLLLARKFRLSYRSGYVLLVLYAAYLVYSLYSAYNPNFFPIEDFLRSNLQHLVSYR